VALRRALPLALAGLVAGAALAGCGADSSSSADRSPSASATASAGPTEVPSGYPSGVASEAPEATFTTPGTALRLGQSATVAWQPTQRLTGVLDVTVTALHSTSFDQSFKGWQLDAATKANAPFFVDATVRNAGSSDLGGQRVPLYGAAASGALVEASSFASDFKPCGPSVLPTPFPAGASTQVCLVYLVPQAGVLDGVTFRPTESFQPITWSGTVSRLSPSPTTPKATTSPS